MNQEQFEQFWLQLKMPLKARWERITDSDLGEIQGNLATFKDVVLKRYGDTNKGEVSVWVDRRYSHWTGNYLGYKDPEPASS